MQNSYCDHRNFDRVRKTKVNVYQPLNRVLGIESIDFFIEYFRTKTNYINVRSI
jgi:hypothetical protein